MVKHMKITKGERKARKEAIEQLLMMALGADEDDKLGALALVKLTVPTRESARIKEKKDRLASVTDPSAEKKEKNRLKRRREERLAEQKEKMKNRLKRRRKVSD